MKRPGSRSHCIACGWHTATTHQFGSFPGALYIFECERSSCRATQAYQSSPHLASFESVLKELYR